jgi:DNA processing protein
MGKHALRTTFPQKLSPPSVHTCADIRPTVLAVAKRRVRSVTAPAQAFAPRTAADAHAETLALLGLATVHGIGYRFLHRIYLAGIPFSAVLACQTEDELRELFESASMKNAKSLAQAIATDRQLIEVRAQMMLERLIEEGVAIVHTFEPAFPKALRGIASPPGWLFTMGNLDALEQPLVAIVGTRTPSDTGKFITDCVCRLLERTNIVTVSGLAAGIDERVHALSLSLRIPTVAVLGTGILRDYPSYSRPMRDAIVARGGCVLTEYLPEDGPGKETFVWRNRLQAGLSSMVIPTEWQLKSGTAHTVRFALDGSKPVVGVDPSEETSETSRYLMKHGNERFRLPHEAPDLLDYICKVLAS